MFLSAVIGMMAAGCARIEPENPGDPRDDAKEEEILIRKSFQAGVAETRTSLEGLSVMFAEGESISIWDGSGNREYKADEAGSNVSFSGQVSASATDFYALSPYSASTVFTKNGSTVTARTTLPSEQAAVAGTFADGLNISAGQSDSDDSFSLDNVMSVVKFNLASANLGGHAVTSVELISSYPLAGDVTVTFGETSTASADANTVNSVKLAKADGSVLEDGTYYFVILPNDGGQISLKFTTSDGYTATRTATLKSPFEAGFVKNLGTVKNLTWEEPKYCFMPVSEVTEGTYLIVSNNNGALIAAQAVIPENGKTFGYPQPYDVTEKVDYHGFIVMDNLEKAFVFSNTGNGYTIRQLYDDKYWNQYSTSYTSISISDAVSQNTNNFIYTISYIEDGTFSIKNKTTDQYLQYSTRYGSFGSYSSESGIVPTLYRLVDPDTVQAQVTLSTLVANGINSSSAVLNASYSGLFPLNVQEVGFYYGTSVSDLSEFVYVNDAISTGSGIISALVESLAESTTYYYQVAMQVYDPVTKNYKEFKGGVMSFTTAESTPVTNWKGWLELPANTLTADNFIYDEQKVGSNRNYTMSYDTQTYAAMWVAYPLYTETMLEQDYTWDRPSNWSFNGHFSSDYQVDIRSRSYGVSWTEDYGNELYARGHQIPNADRNNKGVSSDFQKQTFLVTNSTPQIQYRFNGSIWSNLEDGVRAVASGVDTLYVISGPVFQKIGETKTVKYITPQDDTERSVPVPNYYWKALLKVKRSGNAVTDALAIGFWYEHKSYPLKEAYDKSDYVVSIKDIERWTGLDLFVNLPGDKDSGIEKTAQENSDWDVFKAF